jgi:hypothetical protein
VLGGKDEWKNADSMPSECQNYCFSCIRLLKGGTDMLFSISALKLIRVYFQIAQCPAEDCEGDRAFFYQLQIRSADEPMTTFYKV